MGQVAVQQLLWPPHVWSAPSTDFGPHQRQRHCSAIPGWALKSIMSLEQAQAADNLHVESLACMHFAVHLAEGMP